MSASSVKEGLANFILGKQQIDTAQVIKDAMEFKPALGLLATDPDSDERVIETKLEAWANERYQKILKNF